MRDLYLLLRPRFLGVRNRFIRPESGKRKRAVVLVGLGLVFCGGMFIFSCRVLIHFQSVEVIGDIVMPSELVIPIRDGNSPTSSGALFMSGAKLYFYTGSAFEVITSS